MRRRGLCKPAFLFLSILRQDFDAEQEVEGHSYRINAARKECAGFAAVRAASARH